MPIAFGFLRAYYWGEAGFVLSGGDLLPGALITLALIVVVAVLHEGVHGLLILIFGARPIFGAGMASKTLPVLYCTTAGHRFSRWQYVLIAIAPFVLISVGGGLLVAWLPLGGWLVGPLAFNVSGAIGDLWVAGLTLAQPPGTLVEDRKAGVAFWRPGAATGEA